MWAQLKHCMVLTEQVTSSVEAAMMVAKKDKPPKPVSGHAMAVGNAVTQAKELFNDYFGHQEN